MGKKIILDEDASQILPLLQLNNESKEEAQGTAIIIILGAIAFYLCTYVVKETDQVILTQFENLSVNR